MSEVVDMRYCDKCPDFDSDICRIPPEARAYKPTKAVEGLGWVGMLGGALPIWAAHELSGAANVDAEIAATFTPQVIENISNCIAMHKSVGL